jgi:hypothetical protein
MPTLRGFWREAFQLALYEAQDVLCQADDVDLIQLEPASGFHWKDRWHRRLLHRDPAGKLALFNAGLNKVRLKQDYELFIAVCQNPWDMLYVNAIENWMDRAKTTVCWIDEMWISDIQTYQRWLRTLERFDHVFLGYRGTLSPFTKATGIKSHWLPAAVDGKRFSPYPDPPERVVDFYSVGRRWEGLHQALLQQSAQGRFYIHDTFRGLARMAPFDLDQHRSLFANTAKRSKYFIVAPGKMDQPGETEGQVELGFRFYEGSMSGAVMLGQRPRGEAFEERFPWEDAVVETKSDGSDLGDVLAELESNPERVDAIRRRNASEALMRHDWIYRWHDIFRVAGFAPSAGTMAREQHLAELAAVAVELPVGAVASR